MDGSTSGATVASRPTVTITGAELRRRHLDDAMLGYFRRKLPELDEPELLARIEETLKFLTLAAHCRASIPVTREIDDVWHLWILQTQQYRTLCAELPTGDFLDHCSNDYLFQLGPEAAPADDLQEAVRMLAMRVGHFGAFEPDRARFWRYASYLMDELNWSIDDLNDWLLTPG